MCRPLAKGIKRSSTVKYSSVKSIGLGYLFKNCNEFLLAFAQAARCSSRSLHPSSCNGRCRRARLVGSFGDGRSVRRVHASSRKDRWSYGGHHRLSAFHSFLFVQLGCCAEINRPAPIVIRIDNHQPAAVNSPYPQLLATIFSADGAP